MKPALDPQRHGTVQRIFCDGATAVMPSRPRAIATINDRFVLYNEHVFRPRKDCAGLNTGTWGVHSSYVPADIRKMLEDVESMAAGGDSSTALPRPSTATLQGPTLTTGAAGPAVKSLRPRKKIPSPFVLSQYKSAFLPISTELLATSLQRHSNRGRGLPGPPYGTLLDGAMKSAYQLDFPVPRKIPGFSPAWQNASEEYTNDDNEDGRPRRRRQRPPSNTSVDFERFLGLPETPARPSFALQIAELHALDKKGRLRRRLSKTGTAEKATASVGAGDQSIVEDAESKVNPPVHRPVSSGNQPRTPSIPPPWAATASKQQH